MKTILKLLAPALALVTAACSQGGGADDANDPNAFHILAGSELKDIEPQVKEAAHKAGIPIAFDNAGTLDVIDRINSGEHVDAAWVANGAYTSLALTHKPAASTKTMYSQVLIGVKPQIAHMLGWDTRAPTWAEIGKAAADGRFHYAMTNPAASNSGLSALVSVATSIAGKGDGLASVDVHAADIQGFLKGQSLTSGSSGWLADAYAKDNASLDGIINYESVLLELSHRPGVQLRIIRPADGAVTADYPLLLLNPARRADYDKLVAILRSAELQRATAASGRRPVDASIPPSPELSRDPAIDLPFPAKLDAIDALLGAYLDKLRRPVRSWFVLDRSGSMEGPRMDGLKTAMGTIIQGDSSTLAGRYARLAERERTTLITFSENADPAQTYLIDAHQPAGRTDMLRAVSAITADGSTSLYDAVAEALKQAVAEQARDPSRFYSIVLMTDGEVNAGMSAADFARFYAALPANKKAVKLFPILFGEGNVGEMERLAALTGGRTFDARNGNLAGVFREIRGYQ